MIYINKVTSSVTVDFAAEELKKYLRMMMPEGGDVEIAYSPKATGGFRLGLMQDMGLDVSDVASTELDDILYIDTTADGGIIAGDNPRSVLLAVYEYLRRNGCRWLTPTSHGEYIPMRNVTPVKLRYVPSCRYRGWCNEGATSRASMLDMIDYAPKVGMNVAMIQFRLPKVFYDRYYNHTYNEENRSPEPVSRETVMQWTRECEVEIAKRGLQLHTMGHGFSIDPFGISSESAWRKISDDSVPDETRQYLAMLDGKRGLFGGRSTNTNFCMSNPEARRIVASYIADYAEGHTNADYVHVWLADGHNNHCECDECRKKTPSDWYMVLMNELDAELTRRGLSTRIVFISYVDTSWAPLTEKISNPDRFTLMIAPITRSYTRTLEGDEIRANVVPYERNKLTLPRDLDEYLAYFETWKRMWSGANLCYDYHFWKHQFYDPSGLSLAARIYEDVHAYKRLGIGGIIQCGSERSFFPNGLAYYVHARAHFDASLSFDEILNDYFSHAYGDRREDALDYLTKIQHAIDFAYVEGEKSADTAVSQFYNPDEADRIESAKTVAKLGYELAERAGKAGTRLQTASLSMLRYHAMYIEYLSDFLARKAEGDDVGADAALDRLRVEFGKYEIYIEHAFDYYLAVNSLKKIANVKKNTQAEVTVF